MQLKAFSYKPQQLNKYKSFLRQCTVYSTKTNSITKDNCSLNRKLTYNTSSKTIESIKQTNPISR